MGLLSLLVTLAAVWSASVCADDKQLKESPIAPTIVQPTINADESKELAAAAQPSQPPAAVPPLPPASAQTLIKDSQAPKGVPLTGAEGRHQDNLVQSAPGSILIDKPPSGNPPFILKDILFTPPDLNNDKPAEDGNPAISDRHPLNDKPTVENPTINNADVSLNTAERSRFLVTPLKSVSDSILNANPPFGNPPLILKDILFSPPDINKNKPVQDGSFIIANPAPNDKPIFNDSPSLVVNPEPNDKPSLVDKSGLFSPHSPSRRAAVLPPADNSPAPPFALPSEELKQKLEESLIQIKEAISEASPALIAAASGGGSKVKSETEDKTEKPEEPTKGNNYAEIIGQFVTQLLEIPIVLLGAVREVISKLTHTHVSIQVSHPN